MAGRVASIRGCLTHVCHGRGLGRGQDQARHRTLTPAVSPCSAEAKLYDNDKVDTRASVVSRSARTGPEKNRKPAAPAGRTFRRDPPGFARHFRKHQSKQRRKCRYARQRPSWKLAARIPGLPHTCPRVKPVASKYWARARAEWYARARADGRARAQSRKDTIVKQACFKWICERCCAEV